MDGLRAITAWMKHVKSKKLDKDREKFAIGHPWMFQKEFDEVINADISEELLSQGKAKDNVLRIKPRST